MLTVKILFFFKKVFYLQSKHNSTGKMAVLFIGGRFRGGLYDLWPHMHVF